MKSTGAASAQSSELLLFSDGVSLGGKRFRGLWRRGTKFVDRSPSCTVVRALSHVLQLLSKTACIAVLVSGKCVGHIVADWSQVPCAGWGFLGLGSRQRPYRAQIGFFERGRGVGVCTAREVVGVAVVHVVESEEFVVGGVVIFVVEGEVEVEMVVIEVVVVVVVAVGVIVVVVAGVVGVVTLLGVGSKGGSGLMGVVVGGEVEVVTVVVEIVAVVVVGFFVLLLRFRPRP